MTEENNNETEEEQSQETPDDFQRLMDIIEESDELGSYAIVCRGYEGEMYQSANWTHGGAYHLVATLEVLRRRILRRTPEGYNRLETLSETEHLIEKVDQLWDQLWQEVAEIREELEEIKEDD